MTEQQFEQYLAQSDSDFGGRVYRVRHVWPLIVVTVIARAGLRRLKSKLVKALRKAIQKAKALVTKFVSRG